MYSGIQRLMRRRDREAGYGGAHSWPCMPALYLTCVLWVLSPLRALAFVAIQHAVFSVYLGCSFAPNHKGIPIIEADSGSRLC